MWQLGKWWYGRDGCVWGRVSSWGRALGKWGLSCSGGGHSPDCQTASLQPQLPRIQRLAGSQGHHGGARDCSQSTDHTLVVHQLKQAQGQGWIPFVADSKMKHWGRLQWGLNPEILSIQHKLRNFRKQICYFIQSFDFGQWKEASIVLYTAKLYCRKRRNWDGAWQNTIILDISGI